MIDGEHRDNYGVRTGVDVVVVEEFRRSLERGGEAMGKRLFSPAEEAEVNVESLWRGYLRRRRRHSRLWSCPWRTGMSWR